MSQMCKLNQKILLSLPAIVGLGEAAKIARKEWKEESERIKNLRDKLEKGILERIPYVRINGHPQYRLPNTLNVSFHSFRAIFAASPNPTIAGTFSVPALKFFS